MSFLRFADKNPKVVERWFRMRYGEKIEHGARLVVGFKHRFLYGRQDRRKRRELDKAIAAVAGLIRRCDRAGYIHTQRLAGSALYVLIPLKDIEAVRMTAALSTDIWERKLSLRIIILTIFEWDTRDTFNHELQASLRELAVEKDVIDMLNKQLRTLRKKHEKFKKKYGEIRNDLIAHRHQDAFLYLTRVKSMPESEILEDAGELISSLYPALDSLTDIMKNYGNFESRAFLLNNIKPSANI